MPLNLTKIDSSGGEAWLDVWSCSKLSSSKLFPRPHAKRGQHSAKIRTTPQIFPQALANGVSPNSLLLWHLPLRVRLLVAGSWLVPRLLTCAENARKIRWAVVRFWPGREGGRL